MRNVVAVCQTPFPCLFCSRTYFFSRVEKKCLPGMLKDLLHIHDKIIQKIVFFSHYFEKFMLGLIRTFHSKYFFERCVNFSEQTIFGERFSFH